MAGIIGVVEIAPLQGAALRQAYQIHRCCQSFPWSEKAFCDCEQAPYFSIGIFSQQTVLGYAICQQVLDEITLMDLGVLPSARGKGLGKALVNQLLKQAISQQASKVMLEVRVSNQVAIQLYQQLGFVVDGQRKHYYPTATGYEDALLMSIMVD